MYINVIQLLKFCIDFVKSFIFEMVQCCIVVTFVWFKFILN